MEEVANIPTETPAPPPPPAPDHHAAELTEIRESLARLEKAGEYEIPALSDSDSGREKKVYAGAHDSARFLARRRREAAAQGEAQPSEPAGVDLEIGYTDNRPEVSAKDAARDLADYRQRMAAQLLEGVDPATAAVRASGYEQPAEAQPVEQPAEQAPPTSYTEEQVQQAQQEAQWQAQVAAHGEYAAKIGDILLAFQNHPMPPEFAQVRTAEDWQRLQLTNPALAQQMAAYVDRRVAAVNQLTAEHAQVQEQRRQVAAGQFKQWAEAQDAEFEKHAGTIDRALQQEALVTLRDAGVSDEQAARAWNGEPISLRSAAAQRLVLDATRWRLAEAKAKAAIARPSPPPQRPSPRQDRMSASAADLQAISRQLDAAGTMQQQLRLAGRLVAERRRAQG
jgi:hypothetical protein